MKSLRTTILQRIIIVAAVSFLLSAGFTYYYYEKILVDQMLHNDETKLRQTSRQLQYMSDDIAKFSFSLIISDQLQSFFKDYDQADIFGKFAMQEDTFRYLNNNKGLRKEVTSFALVMPDGETFWSVAKNDSYFQERMKEEWYQNYAKSGQPYAFTEPYTIFFNALTENKTISFIVKVKDIEQSGQEIGELILNLDYSSFESLLEFGSSDFDDFLWINSGNYLLYEKIQGHPGKLEAASLAEKAARHGDGVHKIKGGYMIIDRFAGNNWTLVSYISQQTLLERGRIVIYLLGVFSLTSTILILLLMMPAIFRITRPIMRLYYAMNAASSGNLNTSVSIRTGDELEKLGQGFNRMIEQLRVHLDESIRYEKEKREMELELLLSQFNPHFVYNTLNAVIYMAQKQGNEDIVRMVGSFIRILQDAAKMGDRQSLIPLRGDLGILRDYIAVQSYRYVNMFDVEWDVADEALDCLVPRYVIQPFVENAIFHGICPKDEHGIIRLTAAVREGTLIISVADDGIGMEAGQLATIWDKVENKKSPGLRHIGLFNTRKRLEHLFGGQSSIRIDSAAGQGTTVTIELPAQYR
ncbi:sensor histidine kinase [Paenibacillus abyssi]|uniref:histidine kinase n=1 Tax=Paenibacillus abyssi TaxID=1340531 RepID=A0A917D1S1_9BACL|nr:sensor histidine kinase [Paenibacillus abyssi]GGG03428.1 histidine kinase [Paenibacillus abyssi]